MRLFSFANFELPFAFGKVDPNAQPPQKQGGMERRPVADALDHPRFGVYDPTQLHFPDHNIPVNPGNGGHVTCGLGMVAYDHQATWDRSRVELAGPVRQFFRDVLWDNRVKHL